MWLLPIVQTVKHLLKYTSLVCECYFTQSVFVLYEDSLVRKTTNARTSSNNNQLIFTHTEMEIVFSFDSMALHGIERVLIVWMFWYRFTIIIMLKVTIKALNSLNSCEREVFLLMFVWTVVKQRICTLTHIHFMICHHNLHHWIHQNWLKNMQINWKKERKKNQWKNCSNNQWNSTTTK